MEVKDNNGNILQAGDSIILRFKIFKVKEFTKDLKRATVVKNIRLKEDASQREG
ncbi:MAG: PhnA domain-containing protein [Saprospiraceae bacterium]|nr:PhnA domain-containing protein [Saprospiraceae bacterium]